MASKGEHSTQSITGPRQGPVHAKNGFRYDVRVTAMMVEDMIFNPSLAAKVILDIEMPPHQELRLLMMWTHQMTIDDSGFSTGKSFTGAMKIALTSVLFKDYTSGVLSKTFRQGKLIFDMIERWSNANKLFRNTIAKQFNNKPKILHDNEVYRILWRGGSELRVLPPGFLKDSENLRSERWNAAYCDEWNTYGKYESLTSIIYGRATRANPYLDCPVRGNKIHLFSTPKYKHHESYHLVEAIEKDIANGNADYARFTCNYRHVPRTKKWLRKGLVDYRTIRLMQITNPPGVSGSEIDGIWQKDSLSFYSSYYIDQAKNYWESHKTDFPILTERLHENDIYICAFDMARGSQNAKSMKGDDFAFVVYRQPAGADWAYPCFAFRRNGVKASQAAAMLQKYHIAFGFTFLGYDPQGGGMFVYDELVKPVQKIDGIDQAVVPLIDMEDKTGLMGDRIVIPLRRSSGAIKVYWQSMSSDNVFLNRMHGQLKQGIEMLKIPLAPYPALLDLNMIDGIDEIREYLQKAQISDIDHAHCELYLMSLQLQQVDIMRKEGSMEPVTDSKGMFLFKSKEKKDLAYCLVYVDTIYNIYKRFAEMGLIHDRRGEEENCFGSIEPL